MERHSFDLVVLGAGSGGLAASKRAASYGARVAIVESSRVGGTCVIRGCIPKKLMVYAAEIGRQFHHGRTYGFSANPQLSWQQLCAMRDAVVARLEHNHQKALQEAGVQLFDGRGVLQDPHHVRVGEHLLAAKNILIATGAHAHIPDKAGIEYTITSDQFFELEAQPARAVVVGGGYVALEMASILAALGTETHVLVRERLLRGFDAELCQRAVHNLRQLGINFHMPAEAAAFSRYNQQVRVAVSTENSCYDLDADVVLMATGRWPNTAGLGLENAGVRLGRRGEVLTNPHHQTSTPHIFAVGDVIGKVELTPLAIKAGRALADYLFNGSDKRVPYEGMPTAVFSIPPIATVGATEEQAKEQYGDDVTIYKSQFPPLYYAGAQAAEKVSTFMKLVVHASTDKVLGFHMLGDYAPEIIQGFAAALTAGVTKAQLDDTLAIHPTSAEEFVLMK